MDNKILRSLYKRWKYIQDKSIYSKDKSDKLGEVFTPTELINEMIDQLPEELLYDKDKTWFDPCAGKGNFPIIIVGRLFRNLSEQIPNDGERIHHIIENQLYMAEYQRESAEVIDSVFSYGGRLKVNLYVGNTLEMPNDFFDLSYEDRREKYPQHCV